MTRLLITCAAVLLAACSQREVVTPRTPVMPKGPNYPVSPTRYQPTPSNRPPDVPAAENAAADALKAIEAIVPPENFAHMRTRLTTPMMRMTGTSDPQLSKLIEKYYDARAHADYERGRQRSIDQARAHGGIGVLVVHV